MEIGRQVSSSSRLECWYSTDLLGGAVLNHCSPFKIHQALWNPTIDLLALASQKGEVCIRRLHWRRGWKRDIYDIKPLLLDHIKTESEIRLETMCWSPDGKVLATAFNDGCIHFLDAERGIVRFTVKMKARVIRMRWQQYSEERNLKGKNDDALSGVAGDLSQCESVSDKTEDLNQLRAMKVFSDQIVPESLLGTLLFTIDENNFVHILAAGVLPIASIEPPLHFMGNCDPYSVTAGDVFYCRQRHQLMVVYSSMGQVSSKGAGMNTQVVGFEIDGLGCLKNGCIWIIANRWVQLVFSACFVSEAFARAIIDWEDQTKEFSQKFASFDTEKTTDCSLGECFSNLILTGHANSDLTSFYRNVLTSTEWKKMTDWVEIGFSEIIKNIGSELLPGAAVLQHNMKQLISEVRCALRSCKPENILPKRLFDVDVYPYGKYVDESDEEVPLKELKEFHNLASDIASKIDELHLLAVRNRKELFHFTNWISQAAPFTAKRKQSVAHTKFDVQLILEYVRQTFLNVETQKVKNANTMEEGSLATAPKEYTFDKVYQYFERHKPLKYRLDVRSNSWTSLLEQKSTTTLADSIADCLKALQTIQGIILKNFAPAVSAQRNCILEQCHAEGFEKFAIFVPHEYLLRGTARHRLDEWFNSLQYISSELFAISCIGFSGSRHVIYGESGKLLYEFNYKEHFVSVEAGSSGGVPQSDDSVKSTGTSGSSRFHVEMDFANSPSVEKQQSQKIEKTMKGVDSVMPKPPGSAKLSRIEKQSDKPPETAVSCRFLHFEWLGGDIFFGLLKVFRADKEEALLIRSRLTERKHYVHEDSSGCLESFCSFSISSERKMGIAITDNGFRAKCFEIDGNKILQEIVAEMQQKDENRDIRANEPEENIDEDIELMEQARHDEGMDIENRRESERNFEGMQLRRSARKRKPVKK